MAMPLAALVLQAMATTVPRCTNNDVSKCATTGAEGLVKASGGVGSIGGDVRPPAGGGFGKPSRSMTLTFLKHKAPAWADLPGAELRNVPMEVDGIPIFVPSAQLAEGTDVVFGCPPNAADVCDAWVFFYSCPQSCTVAYQGGVPSQLGADGWQHTICAPHFVTGVPSGYAHHMRSYRKKVQPGETVSFTTPAKAEFLAFGLDMEGVDCSKLTTEMACDAAPHSSCQWSPMGECLPTTCRRGGKGPPPPCTECPWQGIEKRPEEDGPFN